MRKIIFILLLLLGFQSYAQAPEKFTYQSIVRSDDGRLLRLSKLGIKISIIENSKNGLVVYTETHSTTTNRNGLVTLIVGDGVSADNISDIDWASGPFYMKIEVDPNGGIGYTIEQTAQLLSVPYALFAGNSTIDLDKDVDGILPVSRGGTGSSTSPMIAVVTAPNASVARGVLGIGDIGGSKETIVDNRTGLLFKSEDPKSLSEKIDNIFRSDDTTLNAMGNSGRKMLSKNLMLKKCVFQLIQNIKN